VGFRNSVVPNVQAVIEISSIRATWCVPVNQGSACLDELSASGA
jgi:hypothetical protein